MKIGHESRDSLSDTMIRKTILFFSLSRDHIQMFDET
jgi:hypothetical protein